jgi:hypothetical protein
VVTGTTTLTPVASSTVAAITTQVAQTTFQYTNEKIRVANGNGISGEGQKIKAVLISAGFQVASVGNASKQYSETFVFYKTGQQDLAEALKNAIKDSYTATIKEDNSVVGTYDAVIALGSK